MALLEARRCSVRFGGVQAAAEVSLTLGEWEIVGVIGPNGAGKTTMFDVISGFVHPEQGTVWLRGSDITGTPVHERAALGLGRTFQNVGLVKRASVRQNLEAAQHLRAGYGPLAGIVGSPASFAAERDLARRAEQLSELLGLADLADAVVADLPYGLRKQVELAAVLATDPDVVLLDEPSSGLAPQEAADLGRTLLELRRRLGLSIMMIEHHVPLVVGVCDYVYCLSSGRVLAEGEPEEVRSHPEVMRAYLGQEASPGVPGPGGEAR